MGQYLRWAIPTDTDVSYDKTYIYRATSQGGTYAEITNQLIADNEYFDIDGETTNWYKIRFYNSTAIKWSNYSEELQGGTFYGYCTIGDVRDLTGLTSTQISDSKIFTLIKYAMAQLNADILVKHEDERVRYISPERENDIDGVNTTFYTENYPIGDKDNDGSVTISDIYAYSINSTGVRTEYSISSIGSVERGKFVLATAFPLSETSYITYYSSPLLTEPPHMLVRLACIYLTAALSYTKIDASKIKKFRVGKVSVMQQSEAFDLYRNKYLGIIHQIKYRPVMGKVGVNYV
jgi:hypothetical protein